MTDEHLRENFRSGFISVVGRPNVGKSTLVNSIVGEKVSAVSDKPSTTRNRILGVRTFEDSQLIFLDTPGVYRDKTRLGKSMARAVSGALSDADLHMFVTDVEKPFGAADESILKMLSKPSVFVVNKIDRIKKSKLLSILSAAERFSGKFLEIIPISALMGDGVDELTQILKKNLPAGPKYFPDDVFTDQPEIFYVSELIREKVFNLTRKEIPYKVAVVISGWSEDTEQKLIRANAEIYVERKSHKGILIGKGGGMLKQIGSEARVEIEKILGVKLFLELWVKVKENWTQRDVLIKEFGYGD
ncbi:MAG: GTPase Era [Candidatus Dadabacteria bacterium]|nr:GTPase Era [Candidatus Dadabacteria bacterium]